MFKILLPFFVATAALSAGAYLPPEDARNGAFLRIESLDQTVDRNPNMLARTLGVAIVDADAPREIPFTLENRSGKPLVGTLATWMNDDWSLSGPKTERITLAPGEKRTVVRTATAKKDRILNALYPVHATFAVEGSATEPLHPIAVFEARTKHPAKAGGADAKQPALKVGTFRLDRGFPYRTFVDVKGVVTEVDGDRNAFAGQFARGSHTYGGESKAGFATHPPYRKGAGFVYSDFALDLPNERPLAFRCVNALRAIHPPESPSDGVEYKVFVVENGAAKEVAAQLVRETNRWSEPMTADLSPWAGKKVALRLWTGPGPRMNTNCDGGAWGDLFLDVGALPSGPTESEWTAREQCAIAAAKTARAQGGDPARNRFRLEGRNGVWGAAFVPGACGPVDGVLAITDGREALAWRGFVCEVNGVPVRFWDAHLRVRFRVDQGALRMTWDMPGVTRGKDGFPRYTKLGLGPCSLSAKRIYAGFGNVIENPRNCVLTSGGFTLSTRHVGADYANGLSLVQASDLVADNVTCRREQKIFSLMAHHDATFTFVPSSQGAFAAGRAFADVSGYRKSPGFDAVYGRQCLDQWGGDYGRAADDLARAGKYGLNESIFVKHVWQRWGYDYRLPEIYPPQGDGDAFLRMVKSARANGILFAPHDNYIDFYPDAEDYSYDCIVFNLDGTPQRAWFNHGRLALSYRWAPHVFKPWLVRNMHLMRDGFGPDGLFIDVFTAINPMDYLDRTGAFHPKTESTTCWADAFDTCRVELNRPTAPMISEAGLDHLIGHLDAGQSDHYPAARWMDRAEFDDAERTPWHDIVSHGKFVLFAGGLGGRYEAPAWHVPGDTDYNGYGSDDYLCNTVIGGRTPMSDGPFSRRAVRTYWMLHDLCKSLSAASFDALEYGENVHRQHSTFGNGAQVWINRETNRTWTVAGKTLPPYGLWATAPGVEVGIVDQDGQRIGWSKTKGRWFVDARAPGGNGASFAADTHVTGARVANSDEIVLTVEWNLRESAAAYRPFVHICTDKPRPGRDDIVFQGQMNFSAKARAQLGRHTCEATVKLPKDLPAGSYDVRYGMYRPGAGNRLNVHGPQVAHDRVHGGTIVVEKDASGVMRSAWRDVASDVQQAARDRLLGINRAQRRMDFGGVVTDGSFRFDFGSDAWQLVPLPGARKFTAEIDLAAFGAAGRKVATVEAVDAPSYATAPVWKQTGAKLVLSADAQAFAYRVKFVEKAAK